MTSVRQIVLNVDSIRRVAKSCHRPVATNRGSTHTGVTLENRKKEWRKENKEKRHNGLAPTGHKCSALLIASPSPLQLFILYHNFQIQDLIRQLPWKELSQHCSWLSQHHQQSEAYDNCATSCRNARSEAELVEAPLAARQDPFSGVTLPSLPSLPRGLKAERHYRPANDPYPAPAEVPDPIAPAPADPVLAAA